MATNQSLKGDLQNQGNQAPAQQQGHTVKDLLRTPAIQKRFDEMLGKRSNQFMTSITNLYSSENMLQKCTPMSVISSAMVAATMDLPIDKNLGYAYIVPYKNTASFQIGYKGIIQLALRTAQYRHINVIELYEGELKYWNRLTEELEIDLDNKESDKVVGYAGYFELINGFKKTVYWSAGEIEAHKKKFSKGYDRSNSSWNTDYDAMAKKTVIRNLLTKWGILSIDMQTAERVEVNGVSEKEPFGDNGEVIDIPYDDETGEIQEPLSEEDKDREDFDSLTGKA